MHPGFLAALGAANFLGHLIKEVTMHTKETACGDSQKLKRVYR
jgi:hypothetical protein